MPACQFNTSKFSRLLPTAIVLVALIFLLARTIHPILKSLQHRVQASGFKNMG